MWKHCDRMSSCSFFWLHLVMSLLFRFWCMHRCILYTIALTASICLPMKFSVQFSLVSAILLYLYFICILTLFLDGADVIYDSASELPYSVLFLKCEWSFCVPSIHRLPTNFHSYCHCFGLLTYHCVYLARFWWSVCDGDLSSRKFFWHNHMPQP